MRQKDQPIGIFARATGALAATGLSILKAEIATLSDGWIWDTFLVEDYDSAAKHDAHIAYTGERVTEILSGQKPLPPLRKYWSATSERDQEKVKLQPAEVNFDNETTDRYTIILLFAYDRPGLLARVAAVLANLKVVLHFAKIDTHLDQAVDVFYVSELDDSKIISAERLQQIRAELLEAVNRRGD
jgi:[protein-PII] uridylyltransferase